MIFIHQDRDVKRYGIMGGTFDPIHYGHLVAADRVMEELSLDQILFIPTGNPPHKKNHSVTDAENRYAMTLLATGSHPNFSVSRIEIERQGYTYTRDTLVQLKSIFREDVELFFIIGADSLYNISSWKEPVEICKMCNLVVVNRGEDGADRLEEGILMMKEQYGANIFLVKIPSLEISSTDIRDRVRNHKSIRFLVPTSVEDFIHKNKLYFE